MQPISQQNPNIHRAPSSSSEFNKIRNDIHTDLVRLFDTVNVQDKLIGENMDVLLRENFFLHRKLHELEGKLADIQYQNKAENKDKGRREFTQNFYTLDNLSDGNIERQALIDPIYGHIRIPESVVVPKLVHIFDNKEVGIPSSLSMTLYESHDRQEIDEETKDRKFYMVEDKEMNKAIDLNKNTFWVHTSSFPNKSAIREVYGILHIKVPLDVVNNAFTNTLLLHPYPEYSMTITDIQYKGMGESWHRLPNYPVYRDGKGQELPSPIESAGKLYLSFPRTEMAEIKIHFTQRYWFQHEDNRDFVYGFQDINLCYQQFDKQEVEFVSTFSLEGTTKRFHRIDKPSIETAVGNLTNVEGLIEHKLYYNKELTHEFPFGHEVMADMQKVYVKTILKKQGDIMPIISSLKLPYYVKEVGEW